MKLILIRHGHAPQDAIDETRKLSDRGREQAAHAGQWLKKQEFKAKKLIHSPLTRAIETAKIVHQNLSSELPFEENDTITPSSSIRPWVSEAYVMDEDTIVVGHMPFLADFASELSGEFINFPTGGVCILERDAENESKWRAKTSWN